MKNLLIVLVLIISCVSCASPVDITEDDDQQGIVIGDDSYTKWSHANFYPENVVSMRQSTTDMGDEVYWIKYDDPDAEFFNVVISMDRTTFFELEDCIDKLKEVEIYSSKWKDICEEYEFVIIYKDGTNILLRVDKDQTLFLDFKNCERRFIDREQHGM